MPISHVLQKRFHGEFGWVNTTLRCWSMTSSASLNRSVCPIMSDLDNETDNASFMLITFRNHNGMHTDLLSEKRNFDNNFRIMHQNDTDVFCSRPIRCVESARDVIGRHGWRSFSSQRKLVENRFLRGFSLTARFSVNFCRILIR